MNKLIISSLFIGSNFCRDWLLGTIPFNFYWNRQWFGRFYIQVRRILADSKSFSLQSQRDNLLRGIIPINHHLTSANSRIYYSVVVWICRVIKLSNLFSLKADIHKFKWLQIDTFFDQFLNSAVQVSTGISSGSKYT